MSKLDKELAEAIGDEGRDDPGSAEAKPPERARAAHPAPARRSVGLVITLLVMVGAVIALFLFGVDGAAVYAAPVDDVLANSASVTGRKVRITGELVPGSLLKRDQPCEYRFSIKGTNANLPVRYPQCVIPDTFRDVPQGGVEVTVEGKLSAPGEFEASLVMAKCTSKYDPQKHEMSGEKPGAAAKAPGDTVPAALPVQ